jgi:hypothetical protein
LVFKVFVVRWRGFPKMCNSSDSKDFRFSSMANMIEWLLEDNTAINYLSHFCPGNIPSFKPVWEKDDFISPSRIPSRF